ncbi:MAG: molybdopterin-guanine dinucleotide biosynthesis protein B [Chloroflexi bacterium]|nr:molybdopterin-guanine dinucleotide biosynthesis protein B [Chloroflexota bacterium]
MRAAALRTVSVVGRHNSGKTTFLLALLPILVARGLRIGYLKHAHAGFEIDQPDKDSYRARRTGVVQTIVTGGGQTAVIDDAGEPTISDVLERYVRDDLDLVVVEGFKREPLPKIEVARMAVSKGALVSGDDPLLLAVVSDFAPPRRDVAHFSIDDHAGAAELIWTKVLGRESALLGVGRAPRVAGPSRPRENSPQR